MSFLYSRNRKNDGNFFFPCVCLAWIIRSLFYASYYTWLFRKSLILLVLILAGAGFNAKALAADGSTLYFTTHACDSCHSSPSNSAPTLPQLNAAGAISVLDHAIANNAGGSMGAFSGLSASDRSDIVAYFATIVPSAPTPIATVAVPYHGSTSAIPLKLTEERFTSITFSKPSNVASGTSIPGTSVMGTSYNERTAIYTHTANNCSADSFTYFGTGGGTSSTRQVNITVTPPDAPIASSSSPVSATFNTATSIPINLSGGPAASVTVVSPPANGNLVVNGTSSFTYTSSATTYASSTSFTYRVNGPCGAVSSDVTVTINIARPSTPNLTVSVPYNSGSASATSIPLGATFGSISVTGVSIVGGNGPTAHGTATASGTSVSYLPDSGNLAQDSFQYTANWGGTTLAGQGTVTINITAPGAPTFNAMSASVPYNAGGASATTIDLSSFFTSPVSNIAIESAPGSGAATVSGATSINYAPAVGNLTSTSLQIRAYAPPGSPTGASSVATVTINITPPGAPTIQAKSITTPFNTPITFSLLPITGPYTGITLGARSEGGNATLSGTDVTYTPSNAFTGGTETFTYTVTAPGGASSTQTVTATVIALPVVADTSVTVPYNTATTFNLPVTGFTQINAGAASHGIVSTPAASSTSITYTPAAGYTGTDSFTYTATGPGGTTAAATVNITVSTMVATASDVTLTVPLNTPTTRDLASAINGSGIMGVSIPTKPSHGTVTVNGTQVTYTPVNNYFGPDSFTYSAYGNHSSSASAPATVTVNVVGRPDPTKDAVVTGIITSQVESARRFSQAQVSNFQTRLESLHRSRSSSDNKHTAIASSGFNRNNSGEGSAALAARHLASKTARSEIVTTQASGAAYRPAASLSANPTGDAFPPDRAASPASAISTIISALSGEPGGGAESQAISAVGKALGFTAIALKDQTFNLSASSDNADGSSSFTEGTNVWVGGGVRFGTRDKNSSNRIKFSTDGISFGADRRFSDDLVLGLGFGYAVDESEIGTNGSGSRSKGYTIAAYGSYQPVDKIFLDGILGYGHLRYETERYIEPIDTFAISRRSGDYLFGSLTAAYEHRADGLLLSPYGRLDLVEHRLDAVTEEGGDQFSLHYYRQKIPGVSFTAGLRAETAHETSFGWATPRLRVEVKHDFKGEQEAAISYADQINGTKYTIEPQENERNSIVLGIGTDLIYRNGLTLSFDYQTERVPGEDIIQAVNFKLTKNLEGRNSAPGLVATSFLGQDALGIKVDAAYLFDSNVSRSSLVDERLSDRSASLNLSKTKLIPLGEFTRMFIHGFAGGEQFKNYSGLNKIYLGGQAEVQYRSSGDFGTPIYSVFLNGTAENFESTLRDGHRYSVGLSLRKAFTDRIDLFGALANNVRYGKSAVFDTKDYSARMNLDFALDPRNTFYFGLEYRRGDITSSGVPSLANVDIAELLVADDVFADEGYSTYRFDGSTVMWTLGYSLLLGSKDTLDFSLRRIRSHAEDTPDYIGATTNRYTSNQFSILYLTSF